MGRLIDADALIDKLKELGWIEDTPLDEIINEMPTAFDIENVVKKLKEKLTCDDFGTCNYCQYRWCSMELLEADEAIDIVEAGGLDE